MQIILSVIALAQNNFAPFIYPFCPRNNFPEVIGGNPAFIRRGPALGMVARVMPGHLRLDTAAWAEPTAKAQRVAGFQVGAQFAHWSHES